MTDREILDLILEKVNSLEKKTDDRFCTMDEKFDAMDERFNAMDERFNKMEKKLEVIEYKQNLTSKKLDNLQLDVKIFERDIQRDIHRLNDEMETVIEVLKLHELLPR